MTDLTTEETTELERLRALVADYENGLSWGTTCLSCASVLDASYQQWCRADRAGRDAAVWKSNWEGAEEQVSALAADLHAVKAKLDAVHDLVQRSGPTVDTVRLLAALASKPKCQREQGQSARDLTTNALGGDCVITGPQAHEGIVDWYCRTHQVDSESDGQSWWCPTGFGHRASPSAAECPPELRSNRPEET